VRARQRGLRPNLLMSRGIVGPLSLSNAGQAWNFFEGGSANLIECVLFARAEGAGSHLVGLDNTKSIWSVIPFETIS
jgi:hypothetical protein